MYPCFYCDEAVNDRGVGSCGFSGNVELDVISIAVEMKAVLTDDVTNGEQLNMLMSRRGPSTKPWGTP